MFEYKNEFKKLGIQLIFVGNGKFEELEEFIERMNLTEDYITIVTDPTLKIFEKFGLEYSVKSLLNVGTITSAMRAFRKGHRNRGTKGGDRGSHFQQGGVALLDSTHNVQYSYRSEFLGDNPNTDKLLEIAEGFKTGLRIENHT